MKPTMDLSSHERAERIRATPPESQKDFTVYSMGFVYASVCTSLNDDEAVARLNLTNPTGIAMPWRLADEPFCTGEPNGCPCNTRPETHRHLLFEIGREDG